MEKISDAEVKELTDTLEQYEKLCQTVKTTPVFTLESLMSMDSDQRKEFVASRSWVFPFGIYRA